MFIITIYLFIKIVIIFNRLQNENCLRLNQGKDFLVLDNN